jgi:endoglucanase
MNIRSDWMERVIEIVDWAMELDMLVILNSHHDEYIFGLLDDGMWESQYAFIRVWQQIAYTFRDYNERLMFEGLNEPRTKYSRAEWTGGTEEERDNLNTLNQLFVDIVRASGGNNAYRVLMVPTYAASVTAVAQRALVIPKDTVEDRIVVSLHMYAPHNFALRTGSGATDVWDAERPADTRAIRDPINLAYETFVSQGIPVIIGEMGAMNRDNTEARAEWAYYFVSYARSMGMPSIWWDNNAILPSTGNSETFGLFSRTRNIVAHPLVVNALMRAVGN